MTLSPTVWSDAFRHLQNETPDFAFAAWIEPLQVKLAEDRVFLGCPNSFHRDRVRLHHLDAIERALGQALRGEAGSPDGGGAAIPVVLLTTREFAEVEGRHLEMRVGMRRVGAARPAQVVNGSPASGGELARGENGSRAANQRARSAPELRQQVDADREPPRPHLRALPAPGEPKRAAPVRKDSQRRSAPSSRTEPTRSDGPEGAPSFGLDGGSEPRRGTATEPAYSFENFIAGPCNALAREATLALARRRQQSLNLLYLAGLSGMGKSHLARAAAEEARRELAQRAAQRLVEPDGRAANRRPRVIYTTAEQFTSEFVSAMRNGRNEAWSARYRGAISLLVVEDVQLLSGRAKTQQELSHTIAHVLESGGRVLLTGDRAPRDLSGLDDRLRAQVSRGFIAEIDRPDAVVRRHILRSKAAAGGVRLPEDCLDRLVDATEARDAAGGLGASVTELESLLIQVVTTASLLGRPIDASLVQDAIDVKAGAGVTLEPRQIAVPEIVKCVAAFFGTRPEALASRSRRRDVLVPRQLAMYLADRYTQASYTEIGRALGRDHPSVANAIKKIERQVLENAPVRYKVEALCERVDALLSDA